MPRIMFFELKKMLTRRVALVVNVGVLVMLCGIMALNVVQARFALSDGSFIGGPAAIQAAREEREARAGQLSVERILSDVQGYRELVLSELDAADLLEMTDAAAYSAAAQAFTDEQFDTLYDPYWSWLMSPFRRSGEEPYQTVARVSDVEFADYYEAVAQLSQDTLDEGQGGSWEYTTAERAYWTDMEASVPEPVSYGWAGAWDNIVSCVAFLAFAMLAVCVTLTPVFSAEYQEGTDAVLLATRYGRSRLVAAKVAASLLYATVYFAHALRARGPRGRRRGGLPHGDGALGWLGHPRAPAQALPDGLLQLLHALHVALVLPGGSRGARPRRRGDGDVARARDRGAAALRGVLEAPPGGVAPVHSGRPRITPDSHANLRKKRGVCVVGPSTPWDQAV